MLWLIVLGTNLISFMQCMNIDLDHAIIIENPDLSQNKSYFGYSVVLYSGGEDGEKWIKIGAPKATYHGSKEDIQQSGLVYHCPYMGACGIEELDYSSLNNFAKNKDEQANMTASWVGGSMDISSTYKTLAISASNWHHLSYFGPAPVNGGLFIKSFGNNTLQKVSPLKNPATVNMLSYYATAKTGFSMHFIQDRNELMVGAPGVLNYLGTVFKIKNIEKDQSDWEYKIMKPRGHYGEYSGYALTSGYFYKQNELHYVMGLPRGSKEGKTNTTVLFGAIHVFAFTNKTVQNYQDLYETVGQTLYGDQFGEYFGAALAAGDINGDGLDDIVVGAPYRTNDKNGYNHGSVYIIYGRLKKELELNVENRIDGKATNGLFGSAVMFLGDFHKQLDRAFAVSAPNEDTSGVVYIYTYDKQYGRLRISQRISGKQIFPGLRGFGMSLSRPTDMDDNQFSDIAIGSPISGHVVILRTKPLLRVYSSIKEASKNLNIGEKTLRFTCCYHTNNYPGQSVEIVRTIAIDEATGLDRFAFNHPKSGKYTEEKLIRSRLNSSEICEEIIVFKVDGVTNYEDPVSITLTFRIAENQTANSKNLILITNNKIRGTDTFCKECPILSQKSVKSIKKEVMWVDDCGGKKCVSEPLSVFSEKPYSKIW